MSSDEDGTLTIEQAYEAAYRFVLQYLAREPGSESLTFMAVSMQPERQSDDDPYRTNDPASWGDFLDCVRDTREGRTLPSPFLDEPPSPFLDEPPSPFLDEPPRPFLDEPPADPEARKPRWRPGRGPRGRGGAARQG